MKAEGVTCPGTVLKMAAAFPGEHEVEGPCGSHEITFERPMWRDRECEDVIIPCRCQSCGHQFYVIGHVVMTKVE